LNETRAIQLAKEAAEEAGYPWNAMTVTARRSRALLLFPVWRVTSVLVEGDRIVRATVPNSASHATGLEMLSRRGLSREDFRRRTARVIAQAIVLAGIAFATARYFAPSSLFHDAAVAAAFALLGTFMIEGYLGHRAFRRHCEKTREGS